MTKKNEHVDAKDIESIDEVEVESLETEAYDSLEETIETVDSEDVEIEENIDESKEAQLEKALAEKEAEVSELKDRLQRAMAEFDNFRKRTQKEKSQMYENGAKDILEKILPVVDNFERALEHIKEDEKDSPMAQGIEMIYKLVISTLKDMGVVEIEALDCEFNPDLHHAVSHEESDKHEANRVVNVFQKGYKYKEQVLRYSMVKVVN